MAASGRIVIAVNAGGNGLIAHARTARGTPQPARVRIWQHDFRMTRECATQMNFRSGDESHYFAQSFCGKIAMTTLRSRFPRQRFRVIGVSLLSSNCFLLFRRWRSCGGSVKNPCERGPEEISFHRNLRDDNRVSGSGVARPWIQSHRLRRKRLPADVDLSPGARRCGE
jgi:hypothetical protein